jgi:hypothetical protein
VIKDPTFTGKVWQINPGGEICGYCTRGTRTGTLVSYQTVKKHYIIGKAVLVIRNLKF